MTIKDEIKDIPSTRVIPVNTGRRNMIFIFAIITCISCLVMLASITGFRLSSSWKQDMQSHYTVELRPVDGITPDEQITTAMAFLKSEEAVTKHKVLSKEEMQKLMKPWLGESFNIDDLPMSRLVSVELINRDEETIARLESAIGEIPGGSVESYHQTKAEFSLIAYATQFISIISIILLTAMSAAIVSISTQSNVADNKHIIQTLQLIGAENHYIGNIFMRYIMQWSLAGCLAGASGTLLIVLCLTFLAKLQGLEGLFVFSNLLPDWKNMFYISIVPLALMCVTWFTTRTTLKKILYDFL